MGRNFFYNRQTPPLFSLSEVPDITEFNSRQWLKPFNLKFLARAHIQEVAENSADLSHFSRVHDYLEDPTIEHFSISGPSFIVILKARRKILGVIDEPILTIKYYGLGIVQACVKSKRVDLKVLLTSTPINDEHIEINHWIAIKKRGPAMDIIHRLLLPRIIYREFYNDLPIWANKIYLQKPALDQCEKNILLIRKWARQFYDT